jgi:translin
LNTLKLLLEKVKGDLIEKEKFWEDAHEQMRKITSLSKQTILLIHQERTEEAKTQLKTASNLIGKLRETSRDHPAIIYSGMFSAALQEYSEAHIFLSLTEESRYVTPEEIDVPSVDFVLGLADVIGEYRRTTLDLLRKGDVKKSERCLQIMDEIYVELEALDEAYMLVPGLRRKNDVARKILEITRGDVTQEVRRKSLEDYLRRFEEKQKHTLESRKGSADG